MPTIPHSRAVAVYMDGPNKGQMTPEFYRALSAAAQGQGGASSGLSASGGDTVAQDISSDDLLSAIADAAAQAAAARAELAQIANDGVLSPSEKPTVIRDYSVITSEQSGIDAKAVQFLGSGSAEQTNYDNAITALTNYLATLTAATAWNDKNGYTDIVSSDFDDNFNNVYTTRQTLLNAIYNAAKGLADTAQNTANTATNTATAAQNSAPIINPNFGTGDLTGWTSDYGTWAFQQGTAGPETGTSTYAIRTGSAGTPTDTLRNIGKIPVYAGAVVKAACSIRANGANGTCACLISWRDATGAEIHVSQGNTVTGTTLAASFVVDQAPAGAIMAHIEAAAISHTTGSYAVDGFIAPILPDTLDQVPDGNGRYAAVHDPATQATQAAQIAASYQPGQNIVPNPSFAIGNSTNAPLNWHLNNGTSTTSSCVSNINGMRTALQIVTTATAPVTVICYSDFFPLPSSGVISAQCRYDLDRTYDVGDASSDIEFWDATQTLLKGGSARIFRSGAANAGLVAQLQNQAIPAGTAYGRIRTYIEGAQEQGGLAVYLRVTDYKVEIGATCTPFSDYASQYGNNLTVPGSQQRLGDQRNLPSSAATGYGMIRSGTALTAHSTGAVDINDHYVQIGAAQIHYNAHASAVTGLAVGSTYNILTHDSYGGGSPTFTYTTSAQTANSYDDAYVAGQVTIPSSGTGGGGGGGICVCADMWLRPHLRASRARWWHWLDAWDGMRRLRRRVRGTPKIEPAPCVRIITERGAVLDCSVSTPFTLRNGAVALAPEMFGQQVLTDLGWEKVVEVDGSLGMRPVVRIHLGGISYAAGRNPYHRVFSHNYAKP